MGSSGSRIRIHAGSAPTFAPCMPGGGPVASPPSTSAPTRVWSRAIRPPGCAGLPENIGSDLRSAPGAPSRGRPEGPVMPASRLSLDGTWEFLHVSDDRPSGPASVRAINVPAPWQAQFADLRMRAGIGIYRRLVDIPAEWLSDHVWL